MIAKKKELVFIGLNRNNTLSNNHYKRAMTSLIKNGFKLAKPFFIKC